MICCENLSDACHKLARALKTIPLAEQMMKNMVAYETSFTCETQVPSLSRARVLHVSLYTPSKLWLI